MSCLFLSFLFGFIQVSHTCRKAFCVRLGEFPQTTTTVSMKAMARPQRIPPVPFQLLSLGAHGLPYAFFLLASTSQHYLSEVYLGSVVVVSLFFSGEPLTVWMRHNLLTNCTVDGGIWGVSSFLLIAMAPPWICQYVGFVKKIHAF